MTTLGVDYRFTGDPSLKCAGCGRPYLEPSGFGAYCSDRCLWKTVKPRPRKTSTRPRDTQRSKLYAAERQAFPLMLKAEFDSLADCQEWLDTLLDEWWVKSRWGMRRVSIRFKRSGFALAYFNGTIGLPRWAWNRWVILHELAHILCPDQPTLAAHGPEFCATYLELVRGHLGPVEAGKLREAFTGGGVKYRAGVAAVPKPGTRKVVTKAEKLAKEKAAKERPLTLLEARQAAEVLRRAVRLGHLGKVGTQVRVGSLAAARTLEAYSP